MDFVMILQLLIVLGALYVGSRYGSLALGAISGIGLVILVLGFGMKPGNPPSDIATVNFDRSGTDPPLMMPGLVSVIVSTIVGLVITTIFY